jgi:DNA modification methylase
MTPDYSKDGIELYCGDCLEVLPALEPGSVDAVVTDPPYLTGEACVPIRGNGVSVRKSDSVSIGNPWGYSLDWVDACYRLAPKHWIVFCNYKMLGGLCSKIDPSSVFVWRKSNAPRMARPVPRIDCEFIVWSRDGACGRMGEFTSLVIDVPMPQAGCMAKERILEPGSKKALHPCQKPIAVVQPFIDRLPIASAIDPFMGSGTTGVACVKTGRKFIGIEKEPKYFEIAVKRIEQAMEEIASGVAS